MTAALTSVGVQYVSIAVGSLASSNTATITAVGSGAYIIWMGRKYSTTDIDATLAMGRIELTNTTTVTATRGSAVDTNTMTMTACIVDGDTTNFVKTVQSSTIALSTAQTSNTATISAVTNNNTGTNYLGVSVTTVGTTQFQAVAVKIALATTTVTATRNSATSVAIVVGFQCIEYQGAALAAAVQNVSKGWTSGTSVTSTITSVTAANSQVLWGGNFNNASTTSANAFQPYVKLTNATTLTFVVNTDPGGGQDTVNCTVVPFVAGVLTANVVQRNTISLSAATSATLTITAVVQAQAQTNFLNNTTNVGTLSFETCFYLCEFTNTTTITISDTASVTGVGSVEVIEFNPVAAAASASGFNYYYQTMIGRIDGIGGSV